MNSLLLTLISGLSTLLGTIFIFFKIKRVEEFIIIILSISMSFLTLISIFELIPNSLINLINNYKIFYGLIISILVFILGYLTIDKIESNIKTNNNSLYKIGILSMISLMIHNFPEGIAVFISTYTNINIGFKLFIAILLHNIIEGSLIAVPLYYSGKSRGEVVFLTLISGISEPFAALLSYLFLKGHINNLITSYILLFVSGLMISLVINDIYKEIIKYNKNKYIIYGLIIGIILYITLLLI